MGSSHSDEDEPENEPEHSHPPDVAPTAETGTPADADGADGDSRRTVLKATGLLAALGIGSVASSGTAAANPNNHNHLGQIWEGDPGGTIAFGVRTGPNTDWAFVGRGPNRGVSGVADGSSGRIEGVVGRSTGTSTAARGVSGFATADSGPTRGVRGYADSPAGIGVLGLGATGVQGRSTTGDFAVVANGDALVTDFLNVSELGTTGDTTLDIDVDAQRALRIEPTGSATGANLIGGHPNNSVGSDVDGATVGGGGTESTPNEVTGDYGTVAGGADNTASGYISTVGGGSRNTASGRDSTVGGGEKNTASGFDSTVGGGFKNDARAQYATISGGGPTDTTDDSTTNVVYDNYGTIGGGGNNQAGSDDNDPTTGEYATVGGGQGNTASDTQATVGGGFRNIASDFVSTVGGGINNTASGVDSTVGGGDRNTASGSQATVGGGINNTASGRYATIPGGASNTADGTYSFAAGRQADTNGYDGAFVLGDSSRTAVTAQGSDEVRSQMPIYAPSFNTTSARAQKTAIDPVSPPDVLERVEQLDVSTWEFDHQDEGRHIGPMAEDFAEQFALGDDEHIATVDADGVAFAAIQALADKDAEREREAEQLRAELADKDDRIDELEAEAANAREEAANAREEAANAREEAANAWEETAKLEATVAELREENDALTARLAAVEARLDSADTD